MNKIVKLSFILISILVLSSCGDDDPKPSMDIQFENITSTSVEISWNAVDGTYSYDVEYEKYDGSFDSWETTKGTSYTLTDLSPGTKYEITVVAYEGDEVMQTEIKSESAYVTTLD